MSWMEIQHKDAKQEFDPERWVRFGEFGRRLCSSKQVFEHAYMQYEYQGALSRDTIGDRIILWDGPGYREFAVSFRAPNGTRYEFDVFPTDPYYVAVGALVIGAYLTLGSAVRIVSPFAWDSPGWLAARALHAKISGKVPRKALFIPGMGLTR